MCCEISPVDVSQNNRSCCSGKQAINQFSIGSKVGTVVLITLSTTQQPSTTVSVSSITMASFSSSASHSATSSSSITALSRTPFDLDPPDHSKTNGSTIGIAVGASVGAVTLIILCFLIYRYRPRRRVKATNSHTSEMEQNHIVNSFSRPELPGQGEYELSTTQDVYPELPGQGRYELSTTQDVYSELPH